MEQHITTNTNNEPPLLINARDAARKLGIKLNTFNALVKRGQIIPVKGLLSHRKFKLSDILSFGGK